MAIFKKILIIIALLLLPIIGYVGYFSFKSSQEYEHIQTQREHERAIWEQRIAQIPPYADKNAIKHWFQQQDNLGYEISVINDHQFTLMKTYFYQYNLVCGSWTDIIELTTNEYHQIIDKKIHGMGSCL